MRVTGRHPGAIWHASPNINDRRHGGPPDMVVLHHTAMATATAALDRLCDPDPPGNLSPVSCHYLISETGIIWQMVAEQDRAWHAGQGAWGPVTDVNSHSIGIELANTGAHPFSEPQMTALETVLHGICQRWSIPAARVIGHSDMAPHRKSDPGARFDWRRLALLGLAVWPGDAGGAGACEAAEFAQNLHQIGYRLPDGVPDGAALLTWAFRLRFRPWMAAKGAPLDAEDCRIARVMAAEFPARGDIGA